MEKRGRHPNSLANLTAKGRLANLTRESQVEIAKMGAEASNRKQAEEKAKALEREEVVAVLTQVFNSPILDDKVAQQLDKLGLPKNLLSKTLYNAAQKAGVNSNMLRVLLELINALNQQQTNINVNNTPIIIGGEDELQD